MLLKGCKILKRLKTNTKWSTKPSNIKYLPVEFQWQASVSFTLDENMNISQSMLWYITFLWSYSFDSDFSVFAQSEMLIDVAKSVSYSD